MIRRAIVVICTASVVAGLVFVARAYAGNVRLVSDTWDYVCKVEVSEGKNLDPSQNPKQLFTGVQKGWSYTGSEGTRVCYRRSGDPNNCDSAWRDWHCSSNPTSGTDDFSLN